MDQAFELIQIILIENLNSHWVSFASFASISKSCYSTVIVRGNRAFVDFKDCSCFNSSCLELLEPFIQENIQTY